MGTGGLVSGAYAAPTLRRNSYADVATAELAAIPGECLYESMTINAERTVQMSVAKAHLDHRRLCLKYNESAAFALPSCVVEHQRGLP